MCFDMCIALSIALCLFLMYFIRNVYHGISSIWYRAWCDCVIWSGKFFSIWWCNQLIPIFEMPKEEMLAFLTVLSIGVWVIFTCTKHTTNIVNVLCNSCSTLVHMVWNAQEWKRTPIINTKHNQMKSNKELTQRQTQLVNVVTVYLFWVRCLINVKFCRNMCVCVLNCHCTCTIAI